MGLSFSLLLTAAGAVLIWAVNVTTSGINVHTVGIILFIAGIVGFVVSLFFWSSWGGFGARRTGADHATVITEQHAEPRS
jgi:hypothetical protein